MKLLSKVLLLACVTGVTTTAVLTSKSIQRSTDDSSSNFEGETYEVSFEDFDMKVDTSSLYFEISKGDKVWNSGKQDPSDKETTSLKAAFFTNPVSVYFITPTGGESYYSIFDESHYENTKVTFKYKNNGFAAKIKTFNGRKSDPNFSIEFTLNVMLDKDGVDIYVTDLVEGNTSNKLSRIVLYPGFGSTYKLVDGYFLLPDGSGALVDLSVPTSAQQALNLVTYDYDYGISTKTRTVNNSQILSLPMYAIQNEDKGLMASITSGAEYSDLSSKVASISDNYNYTYFTFKYRDIYYSYQGIAESTKKPVPQEKANVFEPRISYSLFDKEMTYSDYANEYQKYLVNSGILKKSNNLEATTRLEYLMAENQKGLFGRSLVEMTSLDFIENNINELREFGNNFDVSYVGYSKGGLGNSYPNCFPVDNHFGKDNFKKLSNKLNSYGVDTSYVVDFVRAYPDSDVKSKNLAMNMSKKYIETPDYYNGTKVNFKRLNLDATNSLVKSSNSNVSGLGGKAIDFMSIGSALFSNHFNRLTSRSDAIKEYKQMLNAVSLERNLRKPNQYMFDSFDSYLSTPLESSHFMLETEDIPFLQMVLSGYKNMYINSINLDYINDDIYLNMLDYNTLPSYLLTEKDPIELKDSMSTNIYTSKYSVWKDNIISTYKNVTETLKNFVGAKFVNRVTLASGVVKNTYDNGKSIIINYNSSEYVNSDLLVSGKGFKVVSND